MFDFACPRCGSSLQQTRPDTLCCPGDAHCFQRENGIWKMLLPERGTVLQQFMQEYETVRREEGRGAEDAAYYRSLPFRDLSGRRIKDWKIRAASFKTFLKLILIPLEKSTSRPLCVLDLGAGNGWLSYQIARRRHHVAALDLAINDFDGLGCYRFYDQTFVPVQAEYDHLPFGPEAADLIVFNASLHYSVDYWTTIQESTRVLTRNGLLAILDSPVYQNASSGRLAVTEREAHFIKQYGFASNALPSENFLTYGKLRQLEAAFDLSCRIFTPYYGFQWALRPLKAALTAHREPAKFHVIEYRKS